MLKWSIFMFQNRKMIFEIVKMSCCPALNIPWTKNKKLIKKQFNQHFFFTYTIFYIIMTINYFARKKVKKESEKGDFPE